MNLALRPHAQLLLFGTWLLASTATSQTLLPENAPVRSHSGQFIVRAPGLARPSTSLSYLATNANFVFLEPRLVPTSCERIKQVLWRALEATAPWRGKIFVTVHPAAAPDEMVTVVSERFKNGWQYQVDLADVVERRRYVRAIVQVLLLEMANRNAGSHSAEIPSWLVEGVVRQLLASNEIEIILRPPQSSVNGVRLTMTHVSARRENPLEAAHNVLLSRPALTFEELSWPSPEQVAGELYGSSAQVFVDALLRLTHGRACLRTTIEELPRHYNWQFAFLAAFQPHFQRPLEVEKWWALQLAQFVGHDLTQTWPTNQSLQKLDQVIHSSVQIRTGTNELPLRAEVPLQTIIRDWDRDAQTRALDNKVWELDVLRLRIATNYVALLDEYRHVLRAYLRNRDRTGLVPFRKKAVERHAATEAVQQLDALDSRWMVLSKADPRNGN